MVVILLPVVELLVAHGNLAVAGGFVNSQGGWYCQMSDRLDHDLVRQNLVVPSSWDMSEAHDTILDRLTWSCIVGPGGDTSRRPGR